MTAQQFHPDFSVQFECKRGECRRTCCRDWEVRLTKKEFQTLESCEFSPEHDDFPKQHLRRNQNGQGDEDYGLCVMRPDGFCTLLDEDGLCEWKKAKGEALCAACGDFPNIYISFLGNEYVFPSLSCEAIVKSLLNREDPIRLISKSKFREAVHYHVKIEEKNLGRRQLLSLYRELTQSGLNLLQDRRFSLDNRMVLLANAMCLVDWMERNDRVSELPNALHKFLQKSNLDQVLARFDRYVIGPKAILAVNGSTFLRYLDGPYQANARRVLNGLGVEFAEEERNSLRFTIKQIDTCKYLKRKENLAGFMRQKEIFLEHALVCEFLRSMVPVTEPSVWDNFKFFNVCYALIKGALLGSFDSTPSDAALADTLVLIHRMFIHNYEANHDTLNHLEAIQLNDLMSMVALAKG